ncbi:hypothetical protein GCM10025867_21740 [Frondihabitans sucicola]|uniref:Uncharacterized protein n=1 Tax=Frondihabitans sucicola TaxID=1268041 RepID=A0ABM8GNC1_9MICO|nr:hypothetical protein GCM10025867_21740 [Frondihabitans sucicola]
MWQQGASRSYIENPDQEPRGFGPVRRRTLVLVRVAQAVLLGCSLTALAVAGIARQDMPVLTFVFLWAAVLLDYAVRSRIRLQPSPSPSRRVQAVVACGILILWLAWLVVLEVRGAPSGRSGVTWVATGVVGYVVILAAVAAAQRARYFQWREPKAPTGDTRPQEG